MMMRSLLVLTLVPLAPTLAQAQPAPDPSGDWDLAATAQEDARREAAVETALEDFPRLFRGRAREGLTRMTTPRAELHIQVRGERVELRGDGGPAVTLRIGGGEREVEHEGRVGHIRATEQDGKLVLRMRGENGTRTTTYLVSEDGRRLVLQIVLTGERLSSPLRYRVTYERA